MDEVRRSQEALRNGWATGEMLANGIRLHYVRTGGDKPPLVMAHGLSENALCWAGVARMLQAEHDCIMYDARRHGLSDDGPDDGWPDGLVHDAAALIKALGLASPGMIGQSMGAMNTAGVAALYPDLLSYAILVDPPWFDEKALLRYVSRVAAQQEDVQPTTRQEWMSRLRQSHPSWHEDDIHAFADARTQYYSRPQANALSRTPPPWGEVARKITIPTLLLTGDPERGAIVTPAVAQQALDLLKRGQVAHIPGAGHGIYRDQFAASMEAIRGFLTQVARH